MRLLFVGAAVAAVALISVVVSGLAGAAGAVDSVAGRVQAQCGELGYGGEGEPEALVDVDLPLQGADKIQTEQMVAGVEYMLERADWRAGGMSVGMRVCDDASAARGGWDERVCAANARAHVADERVLAVIGTYNSGCAAIEIPMLNTASLVMVSPANTYPCLTERVFGCYADEPGQYYPAGIRSYGRVLGNDARQGQAMALLARRQGARRIFIVHDGELYGSLVAHAVRSAARGFGLRVVGFRAWSPTASSYRPLMKRIQESGAQALLVSGVADNNGARLLQDKVATLGGNQRVRVVASDGFVLGSLLDDAGPAANGVLGLSPTLPPTQLRPSGTALVRGFARRSGIKVSEVEAYTPVAFQAAQVVLAAIANSHGTRADTLRSVFSTRLNGSLLGPFRLTPRGDPSPVPFGVYRVGRAGWFLSTTIRVP
jgi:branched-chain amino acid transport system substrate-binding protein